MSGTLNPQLAAAFADARRPSATQFTTARHLAEIKRARRRRTTSRRITALRLAFS
jgi:hypothetical protein